MHNNDPYSYVIDRVNIYIPGQSNAINIAGSVLELELYEDIDNIHIQGTISFLDTNNIFENIDFNGTEYMQISVFMPDSPSNKWTGWQNLQVLREMTLPLRWKNNFQTLDF